MRRREVSGVRRGVSIRGLCEIWKRERFSYLAFLDISKVYDSVWRDGW